MTRSQTDKEKIPMAKESPALNVSITARRFDLTDQHKEYVEKRLKHLKRFFETIMDVHVTLQKEKHREIAEVTIQVNGVMMHGEEETRDIFSSIDLVVDKIEKQIKKYKARLRNRRSRARGEGTESSIRYKMNLLSGQELEQGTVEPRVIRTRTLSIKPLSLDEALMQMDLLNQDFLVFRNAGSEQVNVLYRRPDGDYNLVEPEVW